jgi:hypothetical protein
MGATQRIFFPGIDKNFKLLPNFHESLPEYTKENKIKSKLILIYTVLNQNKLKIHTKKYRNKQHFNKEKKLPEYTKIIPA